MPNTFDENGLTVNTLAQEVETLNTGLQDIYGNDINLDSNSPDGQLVNLFAQAIIDMLELIVQINNGFDPDRAVGRILDERCAINNIARAGGTYTTQPITLVIDRTVTLQGLDADFNSINGTGYTVQDNAGNQFILVDSETFTAGTYSRNFRARQIGKVETTVDTITNFVTIVIGVVSVNNPSAALEVGQNEETDAQLRVRRQQSVAINSAGYLNGLIGATLALNGVTEAKAYENVTNSTDGDGIPAHSIWLIVEGGANTDIANVLYNKKSYGAGMKGDVQVDIETVNGGLFVAKFDRPTPADLYIRFEIQPTNNDPSFNLVAIQEYIAENLIYGIGHFASTAEVTLIAQEAITFTGGVGVPINAEISDDGVYYEDYLETPTLDAQWVVDTTRIDINIVS
jgi:uncharacterized phage protein gp47/JayE